MSKIKIFTINCTYKKGSTGKIIHDTASNLADQCEFIFGCESEDKPNDINEYIISKKYEYLIYYALGRILGLKYCTGYTSTFRLLHFIKKQKPDIVHLHCPNINSVNIPWLLRFLKKKGIPTVVTNHAEFYYTGNCSHAYECLKFQTGCGNCRYVFDPHRKYLFDRTIFEWNKMKNAFEGNNKIIMVAVSPWVHQRMKLSPITKDLNATVIKNGVDCKQVFHNLKSDLKQRLGIPSTKRVLLHVTANFTDYDEDIKGGRFVIELAQKLDGIEVVVVGPFHVNHPQKVSDNVLFIGEVSDQKTLAAYYSMADLTVITSRRETFGMVCAESLCCGTPVVGFRAGGPESIALSDYSEFVEYGDTQSLSATIMYWIDRKATLMDELQIEACAAYSCETMANGYLSVYRTLLGEK